jgi:membrane fusion protein, multidrug efflux system
MAIWVFSGELSSNTVTADTSLEVAAAADEVRLVRGIKSRADYQTMYLEVRGQTKANRIVQVKSEIAGKIEELPGEKGRRVKADDVLCRIAVDARNSEYRQAIAVLKSAQLEFDGFSDLNARGLQSEILMAKAKAALEQSKTRAKQALLALEKTSIVAPFDGVVDHQPVEVGDFLTPGATCVTLMEIDPVLVVGQVAEKNIHQIALEDEVEVELITGRKLTGRVSFIAHSPDLKTRTFPVEVTVANPGADIRAGLTSEMRVPVGIEEVHLISPASMVLDDAGQVGVRIVDGSSRVHFLTVEVVGESPAGVWVKGLPVEVDLITVGHEEVYEGQVVKIDYTPLAALVHN